MKEYIKGGYYKISQLNTDRFISPDYVISEIGEDFPHILERYINDLAEKDDARQSDIARITGIESSLITKYKHGKRKPNMYAVILLCLAMKLTPERSSYLLYSAGYALNDSKEHRIYKLFLQGCAFNEYFSVHNCNKTLSEHGFTMLNTEKTE